MTLAANKDLVARQIEAVWNRGDATAIADYWSPDLQEWAHQTQHMLRTGFPDFHITRKSIHFAFGAFRSGLVSVESRFRNTEAAIGSTSCLPHKTPAPPTLFYTLLPTLFDMGCMRHRRQLYAPFGKRNGKSWQ